MERTDKKIWGWVEYAHIILRAPDLLAPLSFRIVYAFKEQNIIRIETEDNGVMPERGYYQLEIVPRPNTKNVQPYTCPVKFDNWAYPTHSTVEFEFEVMDYV